MDIGVSFSTCCELCAHPPEPTQVHASTGTATGEHTFARWICVQLILVMAGPSSSAWWETCFSMI